MCPDPDWMTMRRRCGCPGWPECAPEPWPELTPDEDLCAAGREPPEPPEPPDAPWWWWWCLLALGRRGCVARASVRADPVVPPAAADPEEPLGGLGPAATVSDAPEP